MIWNSERTKFQFAFLDSAFFVVGTASMHKGQNSSSARTNVWTVQEQKLTVTYLDGLEFSIVVVSPRPFVTMQRSALRGPPGRCSGMQSNGSVNSYSAVLVPKSLRDPTLVQIAVECRHTLSKLWRDS